MMQDVSLVASLSRLVVVALLMAAVLMVLRRTTKRGRGVPKRGPKRTIELLDRQSLGKTQSIAVLRVYDSTLVVGVTDQRIELLTMVAEPDAEREFGDDDDLIDLAEVEFARASVRSSDGRDAGEQFFERLRRRSAR